MAKKILVLAGDFALIKKVDKLLQPLSTILKETKPIQKNAVIILC